MSLLETACSNGCMVAGLIFGGSAGPVPPDPGLTLAAARLIMCVIPGPGPPRARDSGLHRRPGPGTLRLRPSKVHSFSHFTSHGDRCLAPSRLLPPRQPGSRAEPTPGVATSRTSRAAGGQRPRRRCLNTHTHKECLSKSTYPKGIRSLFLKRTVNSMIPATLRDRGTC